MTEIVIVDAARTPIGRFRGSLKHVRADHMGALLIDALVKRAGIRPDDVDDVVFGCVTQIGEQSANIARTALLGAGWPSSIPGMTIDRKCGSAEAAVHVAAGSITMGATDVVVAGGAEAMTRVPMGSNRDLHGEAFGWMVTDAYDLVPQGEAAERIADLYGVTRNACDDFAIESHRRAASAADAGYFDHEIVPIPLASVQERGAESGLDVLRGDETIRRDTSREKLATLKTSFRENGRVTAGNASQICDGASAVLLMSAEAAARLGVKPRARIVATVTVGSDPELTLTGPIDATRKLLARTGLRADDIDLFEVNEAFATVPIAWMKEIGVGHDRLNVNGGAIALGHPLGATGTRIMATMLNELERREGRYALQAICCNGGLGTATLIERIP
ncbi:thiolase family protein [Sphingomonas sp. A2-49]|uniref:thiolase family protein n=1 Tax=Sphingomonas sp. A2-49 TaxID=1391375 RepID=UPI0021D35073|nr:thiolase family protein [Sphingomonas sp. A2-49]MCU6453116.1 thiolase family protein [Sphingomonas sp. A2-49]